MPYIARMSKRLAAAVAACSIIACSEAPKDEAVAPELPPSVSSVRVLPATLDFQHGTTDIRLVAEALDAAGRLIPGVKVTWMSSDTTVLRVDDTGLVTSVRDGIAFVDAQVDGRSGRGHVTVRRPSVNRITLTPTALALQAGASAMLVAQAFSNRDSLLVGRTVTWSSDAAATASVDPTGRVTAHVAGSATVTATSEGRSATAVVSVAAAGPAPVASVTVTPDRDTLRVGELVEFGVILRDASGQLLTNRTGTWASSNTTVATVNVNGIVTAHMPGAATISATSEGATGTSAVTVTPAPVPPVTSVTVSPANDTVNVGQTAPLTATVRDSTGAIVSGPVTWSSLNAGIATVSSTGVVTGVAAGSATIRAVRDGRTGTAAILVRAVAPAPVATVTVTPGASTVPAGQGVSFSVTLRDANGATLTGRTVSWSSSSTGIATIGTTGLASTLAAGTTTITATSEGRSGTAQLTVTAPPPPGTLLFSSDWSTATGDGSTALTDGGRWNAHGNCMLPAGNRVINVVPGSEAGWTRSANVFRVTLHDVPPSPGCGQVEWNNVMPASTTHWGRFYYRNQENSLSSVHNFSQNFGVGDPGAIQWVFFNRHGVPGGWTMNFRPVHLGFQYPYNVWSLQASSGSGPVVLRDDIWYRYEWMVEYVSATRVRFWPRLYDNNGVLLYDANNFYQQDSPGQGTHTLVSWYAAGNSFPVGSTDLARNFGIGNEGRNPGRATGHWYIANFGVSITGWIGQ